MAWRVSLWGKYSMRLIMVVTGSSLSSPFPAWWLLAVLCCINRPILQRPSKIHLGTEEKNENKRKKKESICQICHHSCTGHKRNLVSQIARCVSVIGQGTIVLIYPEGNGDVVIIHTDVNTCNSYHQESQFIPYLSVNVHYLIPSIKNLNSYWIQVL